MLDRLGLQEHQLRASSADDMSPTRDLLSESAHEANLADNVTRFSVTDTTHSAGDRVSRHHH